MLRSSWARSLHTNLADVLVAPRGRRRGNRHASPDPSSRHPAPEKMQRVAQIEFVMETKTYLPPPRDPHEKYQQELREKFYKCTVRATPVTCPDDPQYEAQETRIGLHHLGHILGLLVHTISRIIYIDYLRYVTRVLSAHLRQPSHVAAWIAAASANAPRPTIQPTQPPASPPPLSFLPLAA